MKKTISIIIPFFNEEKNINLILNEVNVLISKNNNYFFEIILMDNNSNDKSRAIIEKNMTKFENLKYVKMSRNFGYQANIKAGYDICKGDAAVQLDADGEDDPSLITRFIELWESGYDVVYGIRKHRKENIFLTIFRKLFYRILNVSSNLYIPQDAGDFRLIDRKVIDELKKLNEKNLYLRGMIAYIGFNQTGIEYSRRKRFYGNSKFSIIKYFEISLTAFTSFTNKPLMLLFIFGISVFLLSLILAIFYTAIYLLGSVEVQGFTTLIIIQLLFFGLQIFILGFFGVYLGYILDEIKNRPNYILDKKKIDKKN